MAKPLKTITKEIKDTPELNKELKVLSLKYGGAWAFSVSPFTHITTFHKFASPSKVPDHMYDISKGRLGHKGKLVSFAEAAQQRERERGYSGDR